MQKKFAQLFKVTSLRFSNTNLSVKPIFGQENSYIDDAYFKVFPIPRADHFLRGHWNIFCSTLSPSKRALENLTKQLALAHYSLTLFNHFRPVKRPSEYFAKEWSE